MVHVGQLIQNLVWIFPNGSTANTKPCLDTSKWWINGPSKTIWMDLNGSTACYQHCSNGITMCVQNQWTFLKVIILNGFKWSISRRVNLWTMKNIDLYARAILGNILSNCQRISLPITLYKTYKIICSKPNVKINSIWSFAWWNYSTGMRLR